MTQSHDSFRIKEMSDIISINRKLKYVVEQNAPAPFYLIHVFKGPVSWPQLMMDSTI